MSEKHKLIEGFMMYRNLVIVGYNNPVKWNIDDVMVGLEMRVASIHKIIMS